MNNKRLARSKDRWLAGVCGGVAEYFGFDIDTTRIVWLLLSLFTAAFPGFFIYIALWILMPEDDQNSQY